MNIEKVLEMKKSWENLSQDEKMYFLNVIGNAHKDWDNLVVAYIYEDKQQCAEVCLSG